MEELTSNKSEALEMMAFLPKDRQLRIEVLEPIELEGKRPPKTAKATREIVAEAGLGTMRRVVAPAVLHGLVLAAVVAACGVLAYQVGWASDRDRQTRQPKDSEPALVPIYSDEDSSAVRDALWGKPERSPQKVRPVKPRKSASQPVHSRLSEFYRTQVEKKREIVPRAMDAKQLQVAPNIHLRTIAGKDGIPLKTSRIEVRRVALLQETSLTDRQVRRVVRRNYNRVKSCLERQLKRDPSVSGKLTVVANVGVDGRVTQVEIETPRFQGTFLEECLVREVGHWSFPNSARKSCQVKFPLLLIGRT